MWEFLLIGLQVWHAQGHMDACQTHCFFHGPNSRCHYCFLGQLPASRSVLHSLCVGRMIVPTQTCTPDPPLHGRSWFFIVLRMKQLPTQDHGTCLTFSVWCLPCSLLMSDSFSCGILNLPSYLLPNIYILLRKCSSSVSFCWEHLSVCMIREAAEVIHGPSRSYNRGTLSFTTFKTKRETHWRSHQDRNSKLQMPLAKNHKQTIPYHQYFLPLPACSSFHSLFSFLVFLFDSVPS